MRAAAAPMLAAIDWRKLGFISKREQANREEHSPVVSAYRWWARRPHSVMGAILDAARSRYGPRFTVSDPFSGGGTVAFEAVRRKLSVYAQDLYPWPATGLATALTAADPKELAHAAAGLLVALQPHRADYKSAEGSELTHVLRVRIGACPHCEGGVHLFPDHLVSAASRGIGENRAYYGCTSCGAVTLRKKGAKTFTCSRCGKRNDTRCPTTVCPHCNKLFEARDAIGPARRWKAVLVQRVVMEGRLVRARLRPVMAGDMIPEGDASGVSPALSTPIGKGLETGRLLAMGFSKWGHLYTERQARLLVDALSHIGKASHSEAVKDRLAYAVIGCAEMPAFLSRWDRTVLKPFEGLANHRYSHTTLAVEMNPLAAVGRGTLEKRLSASRRALEWLSNECGALPRVRRVPSSAKRSAPRTTEVIVATGSSARQAIPSETVQIALTDPPYFDDVQYGELSRLFHVWLSAYKPLARVEELDEAVPNRARGKTACSYEAAIARCLAETRRTLARRGRLVLTFHNTKLAAWRALAGALHRAGFTVRAMAAVHAENGTDHCKRNVNSMLHDLVLECEPAGRGCGGVEAVMTPRTDAEKNLLAMGFALAQVVSEGKTESLLKLYRHQLRKLAARRRLID